MMAIAVATERGVPVTSRLILEVRMAGILHPEDPFCAAASASKDDLIRQAVVKIAEALGRDDLIDGGLRRPTPLSPRFDGLYVASDESSSRHVRFFGSGDVAVASARATPAQVARWLLPGHEHSSHGRYDLEGSTIRFVTTSSFGSIEYSGVVGDDAMSLDLTSHSHINGHVSSDSYAFVHVAADSEPAPPAPPPTPATVFRDGDRVRLKMLITGDGVRYPVGTTGVIVTDMSPELLARLRASEKQAVILDKGGMIVVKNFALELM